jgi:hypothetical protein
MKSIKERLILPGVDLRISPRSKSTFSPINKEDVFGTVFREKIPMKAVLENQYGRDAQL